MLDNKQLAEELITRYAGLPHPMRGMIQEAARRLLQMVPDHPVKAGAMEADSLRQLAAEWPVTNKPPLMTSDEWLRCVCTAAADRIEQMAETIEYARQIQAERDAMAAKLKELDQCDSCKHWACDFHEEPCKTCRHLPNLPAWEWKGA